MKAKTYNKRIITATLESVNVYSHSFCFFQNDPQTIYLVNNDDSLIK